MKKIFQLQEEKAIEGNKQEFYKEVYKKHKRILHEEMFKNGELSHRNNEFFNSLKKGDQNIVKAIIYKEILVKKANPVNNRNTLLCIETLDFTNYSKTNIYNANKKIKTLSNEKLNELIELANDIIIEGIEAPKYIVEVYNIDYERLLKAINEIRPMSKDELHVVLYAFRHLSEKGFVTLSSKVLSGLFTRHHYKAIIDILINFRILKLNRRYRKYFTSNRYEIHLVKIDEIEITNEKALKRVKNIIIERYIYSNKMKIEKLEQYFPNAPVIKGIKTMIQAKNFVFNRFNESVLDSDYKWLAETADHNTCAIYGFKSSTEEYLDLVDFKDIKTTMADIFAEHYINGVIKLLNGEEYIPFNPEKSLFDLFRETINDAINDAINDVAA